MVRFIPQSATNLDLDLRESSRGSTIASPFVLEIQRDLRSSNPGALTPSKFQVCGRLWYSLICIVLICCFQTAYAQIHYPNFDHSMLRSGLFLDRINPDFDVESIQHYKNRNPELLSFFRDL